MESSEYFDGVVVQSLMDTGVAEKVIHAVTATCTTYANMKGLLFAGFNRDYTVVLFMDVKRSKEILRVPYTQVKAEAFEYLESQQQKEAKKDGCSN